jgi:predicted TIM-barrel fold metal-dependent hydrolase
MAQVILSGLYVDPNETWLARQREEIIDPRRPIIDSHHHLWDGSRPRYLLDEILEDVGSGHNVVATVFVECRSMYRATGPTDMAPVGEVEFVNGVAAISASGNYGQTRLCDGIVGSADLRAGADVKALLEAHIRAGGGRFRGIRQVSAWDADPNVMRPMPTRPMGLLQDTAFRAGFACLAPLRLSFDAFLLHPQIPELIDLARAFPETRIVLDHVGGAIGIGSYASRRDEVFRDWQQSIRALAKCENVWVKLGGLGMRLGGFDFHTREIPASSLELANAWRPYIETCIEAFGPQRSMFESNFPPDKGTCSYAVLWNAFKRITTNFSEVDKSAMFAGAAANFYHLKN